MESSSENPVIVVDYTKKSIIKIRNSVGSTNQVNWVYLGKNVSSFLEIQRILGSHGNNISIGEILQANAGKYRQEFIDFLGESAVGSKNPWWYLTSISEKNPFISDLYLNFCYLKTAFDLINTRTEPFFIICENHSLVKAIADNISGVHSVEIRSSQTTLINFFENLQNFFWKIFRKFVFISRFFLRICLAKIIRLCCSGPLEKTLRNPIIIHAWADNRSFTKENQFSDVYFGDLSKRIDEHHKEYFFLLDVLPTLFYPLALLKIHRLPEPWHLLEEYLSFSDLAASLIITSQLYQNDYSNTSLSGLEILALLKEDALQDGQITRTELSYLYYCAGKQITRLCNPGSFFYTFENHIWEKMLLKGIREISDKVLTTGYAHATVNTMELSYSVSDAEKQIIPLPDHILVNGKKPQKVLTESGFDAKRIFIIGSLRYGGMHLPPHQVSVSGNKRILVILSADINRSLEMISKVKDAFLNCDDVSIVFKPHPIQKISRILQYTQDLPRHFTVSNGPLVDLLNMADMAIFSDSTASVEAAARGIPILHLKSDFLIDINIFDQSTIVQSVGNSQQIRTVSKELCSLDNIDMKRYQDLVGEFFSPIDKIIIDKEIAS